jgi:hypothetical protein
VSEREITAQPPVQDGKVPARDGEPCSQCGSPLAADQRYCLNCGKRRGAPRVDYRQRVGPGVDGTEPPTRSGPGTPTEPAPGAEPEKPKGERDYAPLAAVGGIAILGLMLLVGMLIGRGGNDPAPAPAPVVVQGGGGVAAEGAAAGGAGGEGSGDLGLGGSGGKSEGKKAKGGGEKSETPAEAGAVTASENQLEELDSETGEEAAKNALKLPDKIATPGAPPPIDKSKPPGGGEGGGMVIK